MKSFLLLLTAFLLCAVMGCAPSPAEVQAGLDQEVYVGKVNGHKLYMVHIRDPLYGNGHFIYFFKDDATQPVSIAEPAGKSTQTIILIDGVPYKKVDQ